MPTLLSTNTNRAFSKMDDIKASIAAHNVQVFAATETWFDEYHTDDIISVNNFCVFRDDRSDGRMGGGVAVWTLNSLPTTRYEVTGPSFGVNCVCLIFNHIRLCLLCLYIPPSSVLQSSAGVLNFISTNLDELLLHYPDYHLFLTGDFNRLDISDLLVSFDLKNVVNSPTRGNAFLDLVLLSTPIADQYEVEVGPPIASSDHRVILCKPETTSSRLSCVRRTVFDLRESNKKEFLYKLSRANFTNLYNMDLSLDQKCTYLNDVIFACFSRSIPSAQVLMTDRDKPFITPLIKSLINQRWSAYRKGDFPLYLHLKLKVQNLIRIQKAKWTARARNSPKDMWKVVNEATGGSSSRHSSQNALLKQFVCPLDAVGEINHMFISNQARRPAPNASQDDSQWSPSITTEQVFRELELLKPFKAPGHEGIPTIVYKIAAPFIAAPLAHIINVSIRSQQFPLLWKHSIITPVPKTSPPSKNELRPISLLPILSKVCEKVILCSGLIESFRMSFGENQFGNMKHSSITASLICIHDYITSFLESQDVRGVALIAYDFSKAFDRLGHDIIVETLQHAHFPPGFALWVCNYLTNRTQAVRLLDHVSYPLHVISGVPQGSVLGPFLFNAVLGSLTPVNSTTKIVKYVDDCTFIIPIHSVNDQTPSIEHEGIRQWSLSTGLSLNLSKTKWLWMPKSSLIPPPSLPSLSLVTNVRILGVILSSDLKWDSHFSNIVKCASKRLYALRILRSFLPKKDLKTVYQSMILSLLEYCSPLFIGMSQRNKETLTVIQKRAHRIICHRECKCDLFEDLCVRRRNSALSFFSKIEKFEDHPLRSLCPTKCVRSGRYLQPPAKTTRRRNSFFPAITILANNTFVE